MTPDDDNEKICIHYLGGFLSGLAISLAMEEKHGYDFIHESDEELTNWLNSLTVDELVVGIHLAAYEVARCLKDEPAEEREKYFTDEFADLLDD